MAWNIYVNEIGSCMKMSLKTKKKITLFKVKKFRKQKSSWEGEGVRM
jgi:hypothetical protein